MIRPFTLTAIQSAAVMALLIWLDYSRNYRMPPEMLLLFGTLLPAFMFVLANAMHREIRRRGSEPPRRGLIWVSLVLGPEALTLDHLCRRFDSVPPFIGPLVAFVLLAGSIALGVYLDRRSARLNSGESGPWGKRPIGHG